MKSPQTHSDAAEQGDVVCQGMLTHAVFDFQLVFLFLELITLCLFGFCFLIFFILLGNGSYQHWQSGIGTLDTSIM